MGGCDSAPVVAIGHALHEHATVDSVAAAVAAGETHPPIPEFVGLDAYRAGGGYRLLEACLAGERKPEEMIESARAFGAARARRRRVSDRAQMASGAARSRRRG